MADETVGRVVEAHEASINTATVEVKTLTIKGKQLTMSVFRQIPIEPIIVPVGNGVGLAGMPWGRVHYFPAPCDKKRSTHLHVIWQKGGQLRRACVDPAVRWDLDSEKATYQDHIKGLGILLTAFAVRYLANGWEDVKGKYSSHGHGTISRAYPVVSSAHYGTPGSGDGRIANAFWGHLCAETFPKSVADVKVMIEEYMNGQQCECDADPDEDCECQTAMEIVKARIKVVRGIEAEHDRLYQTIATGIPQLFIAV